MLCKTGYGKEAEQAIVEGSLAPAMVIHLLKQQLIEAAILNHNLERVISTMEWKAMIEGSKGKIRVDLCRMQEGTIGELDQVLEKTRLSHQKLRKRVEKYESDIYLYDNSAHLSLSCLNTENSILLKGQTNSNSLLHNRKKRFLRTFNRKSVALRSSHETSSHLQRKRHSYTKQHNTPKFTPKSGK